MTTMNRIATFAEFWPYYLGEHRVATCRRLHFVGTTIWLALLVRALIVALPAAPVRFAACFVVAALLLVAAFKLEPKRNPMPLFIGGVIALVAAAPWALLPAAVSAYFFAWLAHFGVEKNRPATFTYPAWSLFADHRMYAQMLTGRLWSGDTKPAAA